MQLDKHLILFRYILRQFGYSDFADLRDEFSYKADGVSTTGYTFWASTLMGNAHKLVEDRLIQQYDEAIQAYEKRLRENRAEPFLTFKYYQWLSLLFTEHFFHVYQHPTYLVNELNAYLQEHPNLGAVEPYQRSDLKKLAYWMATGSGKTLLMHCHYWQITKHFPDWENMILITPNEGLSRQHYESLVESGIPAKLYSGSEESLKTKEGEILILEITKLVKNKEGEGVSVDVDYFSESRNLVFIDEGHKGSKSEEQTWKLLREYLVRGEDSFTFEYSATFGQVITSKNKFLFNEYAKSIIFDYSYRHFYTDGYGKDFTVLNLDVNEYSEEQHRLLLTASLLGYFEQLELFERHQDALRQYNIEKPLWVFVGSRVISASSSLSKTDKESISDVSQIVKFFQYALANPIDLQKDIDRLLGNDPGLRNANGDHIFKGRFTFLKEEKFSAGYMLDKVFNGVGSIEASQIKQADGEIGLKTKTSDQYFAVINIGDVPKYAKTLEEDTEGELSIQDDHLTKSLFQALSETNSTINILIGSKKFIEGWNSWRVSSMGLMNMGKSEGAQIIQLFGRGVRLKGKDLSLKREEANAPYYVKALQTISIMGLNASYMNRFLEEIEKEVPEYTEFPIPIRLNYQEQWNGQLVTFRTEQSRSFKDELITLQYSPDIAKRVTIDLRSKISVAAGGFNSQVAEDTEPYSENFLKQFSAFIDYNALLLEANRYKLLKGYYNLIISIAPLHNLIDSGSFNLYSHHHQFGIEKAIAGKVQAVAVSLVRDYINKFYADKEKAFVSEYLTYDFLDHSKHVDMFPAAHQMIVKIPKTQASFRSELEAAVKDIYDNDHKTLPSLHFDKHIYSPIISIADGNMYKEIKTIPVRLNKGERDFLQHLRAFVRETDMLDGKDIFLLRNLSVKGVGFFMESAAFYPDFILWVVDGKRQYIYFLDPKGIQLGETHFNNPKVLWCKHDAPALEKKIQQDLSLHQKDISVRIAAFILSVTSIEKAKKVWSEGKVKREEFENNHILFIEEDKAYLHKLFENFTIDNSAPV